MTAQGFTFNPSGPYTLRNYDGESLDDLVALHGLVTGIVQRHKLLIPGSMGRLMNTWSTDLLTAIEAKYAESAEREEKEREAS